MATTSLLDLLLDLVRNPDKQAAFLADPSGYLQSCGLDHLSADDVADAVTLASDSPHHGDGDSHEWHPAPPVHHEHGADPHAEAVNYLRSYIVNNYVDARETNIDQSFHQIVDTHGGDFDQDLNFHPTSASGDGAVAIGGDNHGPIATGDHSVAGNGNVAVDGNDNALSFGSGSAVNEHGASADHGGAISGTGPASGSFSPTDSHDAAVNFGSGSAATADHGSTVDTTHTTIDTGHNTTDSHNTTDTHTITDSLNSTDSHAYSDDYNHSLDNNDLHHDTTTTDSHDTTTDLHLHT